MRSLINLFLATATVALALIGIGGAAAQDKDKIIAERQKLMKDQGRD